MQISDEMIVKCVCQHCQRVTVVPQETRVAALSAAEPVAWRIVGKLDSGSTTWKVVEHEHQAREEAKSWEKMCAVEVHPLYAAPPAPSVAVKALEWDGTQAYTIVGDYWIINAEKKWLYLDRRGCIGCYEAEAKAKAAAQEDYEARIRSALSAQVQDVALERSEG